MLLDHRVIRSRHFDRRTTFTLVGLFVHPHGLRFDIEDTAEVRAGAHGPVERCSRNTERRLDLVHQLERVAPGLVKFVDEREDRQAMAAADFVQLAGLRLDALCGVDDHDDRVGGDQRAVRVFAEVLVAGCIEQRDAEPVEVKLKRGGGQRDAALLLHLHPVGHDVALALAAPHRPGQFDGPGVEQDLFGQRAFAGVRVGNDGKRPPLGDLRPQFPASCALCDHAAFSRVVILTRISDTLPRHGSRRVARRHNPVRGVNRTLRLLM